MESLKPLEPPDRHHYRAATGWLELGDPAEAAAELAQVSALNRTRLDVLDLEWRIAAGQKSWASAFETAEAMVGLHPGEATGWVHRAYAARRRPGGGLEEALALLEPAAERFPTEAMIPFNLACYLAQLGRLDEAWKWLGEAERRGGSPGIRKMALADPDLAALWPRITAIA